MSGRARALLRATVALALLGGVTWGSWRWGRDAISSVMDGPSASSESRLRPTPEMAEQVFETVDAFRRHPDSTEISLSAIELESLVRYSAPGVLPEGTTPPRIEFGSERIHLEGRVAVDAFPPVPEVERLVGVLPDTVSVDLAGSVLPYEEGRVALRVERIRVGGVPLPRRLTPRLLEILGREDRPGLPADAMDVPLPAGLGSAYIHSNRLVVTAEGAPVGPPLQQAPE
ncbi:MAG: hypothetical protein ACLFWG_04570 [Longimicrobiales bacterium]